MESEFELRARRVSRWVGASKRFPEVLEARGQLRESAGRDLCTGDPCSRAKRSRLACSCARPERNRGLRGDGATTRSAMVLSKRPLYEGSQHKAYD